VFDLPAHAKDFIRHLQLALFLFRFQVFQGKITLMFSVFTGGFRGLQLPRKEISCDDSAESRCDNGDECIDEVVNGTFLLRYR
jgi:hypothetical protein